jgi:hypothetical protein
LVQPDPDPKQDAALAPAPTAPAPKLMYNIDCLKISQNVTISNFFYPYILCTSFQSLKITEINSSNPYVNFYAFENGIVG